MSTANRSLLSEKIQNSAKVFFKSRKDYEEKLLKEQQQLVSFQQKIHQNKQKIILVFEGPDAAGKGGAIKRITQHLDPRGVSAYSTGKPTDIEVEQNYWQRFFLNFPKAGNISIFDRSWYGRVLVERVEKLTPKKDWMRAYNEINQIEKMLHSDGVIIMKFLLDITHTEQKNRFTEREKDPFKYWKLTEEDWRNRKHWQKYYEAFCDMISKTSTKHSPWEIIPANSKWFARVKILQLLNKKLSGLD